MNSQEKLIIVKEIFQNINNLGKKRVSCGDEDLPKVVYENVDEVQELGDMRNGFYDREIIFGNELYLQ